VQVRCAGGNAHGDQANSTTASTSTATPIGRTGQATAEQSAPVTEGFDHQVRAAVHDLGDIDEIVRGVDEAAQLNNARDAFEVAGRGFHLRDKIDATGARGLLALFQTSCPRRADP